MTGGFISRAMMSKDKRQTRMSAPPEGQGMSGEVQEVTADKNVCPTQVDKNVCPTQADKNVCPPSSHHFIGHAKLIGGLTLVSRFMGLGRESVPGHYLG